MQRRNEKDEVEEEIKRQGIATLKENHQLKFQVRQTWKKKHTHIHPFGEEESNFASNFVQIFIKNLVQTMGAVL